MSTLTINADLSQLDLLNKELWLYARLSGKTAEGMHPFSKIKAS